MKFESESSRDNVEVAMVQDSSPTFENVMFNAIGSGNGDKGVQESVVGRDRRHGHIVSILSLT